MSRIFNREDLERLRGAIQERTLGETQIDGVLEQPVVQKEISALVDYLNPLRQSIPRKSGSGTEWLLNRRNAGSTVAEFVGDTDSLTEDVSSYTRVNFPYKTIATRGKVTRKAQAEGRNYIDVLMNEIQAKVEDFRDFEDQWLIKADKSVNSKQFDGIWKLITDDAPATQRIAMTSAVGGVEVDLNTMDKVIDRNRGMPNLILCSRAFRRQLQSKLQSQQQFVNETEIAGGFKVMSYNGIPVLPTTSIPDNIYVPAGGTPSQANITGGTGSTSLVLVLDLQHLWVGELTPFTTEPLANKSSQYDEFDMYEDITVVLNNTLKISALYNVNTSGS